MDKESKKGVKIESKNIEVKEETVKNKTKKKLIIVIGSILLGSIVVGLIIFFIVSFVKKQEFLANKEEYIVVYNKARLGYADSNLGISLSIATEGYNNVINDTILYWDDYIDNQVYGYSKYGMKTFSDVHNKVYNKNKNVFDNRYDNKKYVYDWYMFVEETEVTDPNAKYFKESMINVYNSYEELYASIFAFNTSFNGFKRDTNTKIYNYNNATNNKSYYSEKYGNKYLNEYDDFVVSVGFDKYCDIWSKDEYGYGYSNFQKCYEKINEKLKIE